MHLTGYPHPLYKDRRDAGRALTSSLLPYAHDHNPIILSLPRGGVVVGYEIASALDLPMEIIGARKIGAPGNPEFGIGAISEHGSIVLNKSLIDAFHMSDEDLTHAITLERKELDRRILLYRDNRPLPYLEGRTVIMVDDGLATGSTALAAVKAILSVRPHQIIFASPICSQESAKIILSKIITVKCLKTEKNLQSVSPYYKEFNQLSDAEVIAFLDAARQRDTYDSKN